MKKQGFCLCLVTHLATAGLLTFSGCDSGEKARDELTGNRAVKQHHQSTKNVEKIVDRQTEKHKNILDDEKQNRKSQ